ncbi:MAG: tRNA uridine-5-carboxymethylaminomethyl(34) synthesis GTPase MnmE, partial [Bacteroidetes bacterium SW_10_40_5]
MATTTHTEDTIAAIATPAGQGAIGIIRVSGPQAISIVDQLLKSKRLEESETHKAHYGSIRDEGKVLDDVVLTIFRNPSSYTGEDVIEISCHGSGFVLRNV